MSTPAPTPSPAAKAARAARLAAFTDAVRQAGYRMGDLTVSEGAPHAHTDSEKVWDRYSKGWHRTHGPALSYTTTITAPSTWGRRVAARGLAVCDYLLTLDSEPIAAPDGYEAFRASWVEQGRGYDVSVQSGVIVRALGRDARTAHVVPERATLPATHRAVRAARAAASVASAARDAAVEVRAARRAAYVAAAKDFARKSAADDIAIGPVYGPDPYRSMYGLGNVYQRALDKLTDDDAETCAALAAREAAEVALRTTEAARDAAAARLSERAAVAKGITLLRRRARAEWASQASRTADLSAHRDVRVTLRDSAAVGNCDTGTRSWCARAGLDPSTGATVGQVLDALAAGAGLDKLALSACRAAVARALRSAAPAEAVA